MTPPADQRLFDLYDDYCHSGMERREFLRRAAAMGLLGAATALLPDYAQACQVSFTDERIVAEYVRFPSPGGSGPELRAYVVGPKAQGPVPAVVVAHENRGLNPYIEDVARRLAVAGYLAVAPDALWAVGGYPGNDEAGKKLQAGLERAKILADMVNAARFAKAHPRSNGKLGAVGFCFGGLVCHHLAVTLGADLQAAVPYYGRPPEGADASAVRAHLLMHFAENDEGVNAARPGWEAALTAAKVDFASHVYPGTQHGFHNDSTPRFGGAAATLSWERTLAHFGRHLA